MSNILAALGRGQLEHLDRILQKRRSNNTFYRNALKDVTGITFMPEADYGRSNCWLTCITIDPDRFGATNEQIRLALEAENIEARPTWKPMHQQPVFNTCRIRGRKVADAIFSTGLCLPSGTGLTQADLERIVTIIRSVPARH